MMYEGGVFLVAVEIVGMALATDNQDMLKDPISKFR